MAIRMQKLKVSNEFPADVRPPVAIVHIAFQIMVACGVAMMLVALWAAWRYLRGRRNQKWLDSKWFLRLLVAACAARLHRDRNRLDRD